MMRISRRASVGTQAVVRAPAAEGDLVVRCASHVEVKRLGRRHPRPGWPRDARTSRGRPTGSVVPAARRRSSPFGGSTTRASSSGVSRLPPGRGDRDQRSESRQLLGVLGQGQHPVARWHCGSSRIRPPREGRRRGRARGCSAGSACRRHRPLQPVPTPTRCRHRRAPLRVVERGGIGEQLAFGLQALLETDTALRDRRPEESCWCLEDIGALVLRECR